MGITQRGEADAALSHGCSFPWHKTACVGALGEAQLQPQLLSQHPTPQNLHKASAPRAEDPTELTLPFLFINKHLCRVTKMY